MGMQVHVEGNGTQEDGVCIRQQLFWKLVDKVNYKQAIQ